MKPFCQPPELAGYRLTQTQKIGLPRTKKPPPSPVPRPNGGDHESQFGLATATPMVMVISGGMPAPRADFWM